MLVRLGSLLPLLFLLLYLLPLAALGARIVIVSSERRWPMAIQEYNELLLPVSILCASALVHPLDALILLIQLALFPDGRCESSPARCPAGGGRFLRAPVEA
jgi:hypothetical protein